MSWWIMLKNPETGDVLQVEHHKEGADTHLVRGDVDAKLRVPYNYSEFYFKTLDDRLGFLSLHEKPVADALPLLESALAELGDKQDIHNVWAATPGNAGHALAVIISWCHAHPTGVLVVR